MMCVAVVGLDGMASLLFGCVSEAVLAIQRHQCAVVDTRYSHWWNEGSERRSGYAITGGPLSEPTTGSKLPRERFATMGGNGI